MKRIIEIEESDLERIREIVERENKTALSVTTRGTAYITIADSKLYDDCDDCISRSKLQEDFKKELNFGSATAYIRKLNSLEKTDLVKLMLSLIDNAPPVPERDYSQGWHDAITKALNEAYTITTEDGSFKVVQTETLEGLGMSMPDKKGECFGSCYLCDVGDCGADMRGGAE